MARQQALVTAFRRACRSPAEKLPFLIYLVLDSEFQPSPLSNLCSVFALSLAFEFLMASSLSPPATPPSPRAHPSTPPLPSSSPASDDSEFIEDLSFDYIFDIDGNFVRTSTKGAPSVSKSRRESSSPATTEESFQAAVKDILGPLSPPSLVSPPAHTRRSSLSRSESYSAPNVLAPPPPLPSQSVSQARSFQRVASVPASVVAPLGHASSLRAMRPLARRITSEDRESNQDPRSAGPGRVPVIDEHQQEEKENLGGVSGTRPLSFPLPATHQDEVAYVPTTSTPGPPSTKLQGPTRLVSTVRPRVDAYAGTAGRQQQAGVQRSQSQTQRGPQRVTRSAVSFGKVETIKPTEPDEDTDIGSFTQFRLCTLLIALESRRRRANCQL